METSSLTVHISDIEIIYKIQNSWFCFEYELSTFRRLVINLNEIFYFKNGNQILILQTKNSKLNERFVL
jgi:hypothetical protein